MLEVKENEMVVLSFNYGEFVLPPKDAITIMEMLQKAERYETKYQSGGENTHHIYTNNDSFTAKVISDDLYRMAKLAGKPEK